MEGLETGDRVILTTGTITQAPIPTDSATLRQMETAIAEQVEEWEMNTAKNQ